MVRRVGRRVVSRKPISPPPPETESPFLSGGRESEATLISRIYTSILSAIETGVNTEEVLSRYMPLLLNEIDVLGFLYSYIKDVFIEAFNYVWDKRFKNIPRPVIDADESAVSAMAKVIDTLRNYADRLENVGYGSAVTTSVEVEENIMYAAVNFMECVCRMVFRLMGVLK